MGNIGGNIKANMAEGMKDNLNRTMDAQKGIAMKQRQAMMAAQLAAGKEMFRY